MFRCFSMFFLVFLFTGLTGRVLRHSQEVSISDMKESGLLKIPWICEKASTGPKNNHLFHYCKTTSDSAVCPCGVDVVLKSANLQKYPFWKVP